MVLGAEHRRPCVPCLSFSPFLLFLPWSSFLFFSLLSRPTVLSFLLLSSPPLLSCRVFLFSLRSSSIAPCLFRVCRCLLFAPPTYQGDAIGLRAVVGGERTRVFPHPSHSSLLRPPPPHPHLPTHPRPALCRTQAATSSSAQCRRCLRKQEPQSFHQHQHPHQQPPPPSTSDLHRAEICRLKEPRRTPSQPPPPPRSTSPRG